MIEFQILKETDIKELKVEWDMLIHAGKKLYLWSKTVQPETMCQWCKDNGVFDYIWDYIVKDSVNYSKADFVVDIDERFVSRFKAQGVPGNVVKKD